MSFRFPWQIDEVSETEAPPPNLIPLLETIRESVIIVGEDMRILISNTSARNAFARKEETLVDKRLSEIIRDFDLHDAFQKALRERKSSDIKIEIVGFDRRRYDAHIAPFEFGGKIRAIGFFYDITKIEHLETVRQEFLSNISHELRTPLTSILAFVETLEDGAINDVTNNLRFLGVIRKNAERMHRLIDDISELSMIESGRIRVEIKPRHLATVIEEIFTNLYSKAQERNICLKSEVAEDTIVFADALRLEQMLTNLIDNAIKFNRDGGSVTVTHKRTDEKDYISVADTGEGIPNDHLPRVFERFYRTDRARSREIGGTGLGLAIVKHLARLHGGEVSAASNPGCGTTFTFELSRRAR
jgi:two-component system, OmpR family, phosphate regulon sensor histidine kinase PhoR